MWVRKSPQEVSESKWRCHWRRVTDALGYGLLAGIARLFISGGRLHGIELHFSIGDIRSDAFSAVILGAFTAIVLYLFELLKHKRVVCPRCGKTEDKGNSGLCSCGGHFENLDDMKWEE